MKSVKILHVIPSLAPCRGGPSKAAIEMVYALRSRGTDAEIITTNDDGTRTLDVDLNTLVDYKGVPVRFFKRFSPPVNALREFAYSWSFQRWLKRHIGDYDLIHVHAIFSFCSSYTMHLARINNIPYVVRPLGQLEPWSLQQSPWRKKYYLKWIELENLIGAVCVHFTAQSERQRAEQFAQSNHAQLNGRVIPLGIEVPMRIRNVAAKMYKRWDLDRSLPTILYLSRLHPKKGLELLLEALAKLDTQIETHAFQLLIAGDGDPSYRESLEQLTQQLGIAEHCYFLGHLQGMEKNLALQGADLFALTSHSENFGIAVLEALSAGTAVLISDGVALSEDIKKNTLGFVCEIELESIVKSLIQALGDMETTNELGVDARRFVEKHYRWSEIAEQLNKLYMEIASRNTD